MEISAGGIVFERRHDGPHVAFIRDAHGKWTFAKGHVRIAKGESLELGAIRETEEEMGLRGLRTIHKLGTTDIWFRDRFQHKGALVHKFITYYLMEAPAGSRRRTKHRPIVDVAPGKEPPPEEIVWVPLAEAERMPIYPNTQRMLKLALKHIRRSVPPPAHA